VVEIREVGSLHHYYERRNRLTPSITRQDRTECANYLPETVVRADATIPATAD
jgi:hypothetical protein